MSAAACGLFPSFWRHRILGLVVPSVLAVTKTLLARSASALAIQLRARGQFDLPVISVADTLLLTLLFAFGFR